MKKSKDKTGTARQITRKPKHVRPATSAPYAKEPERSKPDRGP